MCLTLQREILLAQPPQMLGLQMCLNFTVLSGSIRNVTLFLFSLKKMLRFFIRSDYSTEIEEEKQSSKKAVYKISMLTTFRNRSFIHEAASLQHKLIAQFQLLWCGLWKHWDTGHNAWAVTDWGHSLWDKHRPQVAKKTEQPKTTCFLSRYNLPAHRQYVLETESRSHEKEKYGDTFCLIWSKSKALHQKKEKRGKENCKGNWQDLEGSNEKGRASPLTTAFDSASALVSGKQEPVPWDFSTLVCQSLFRASFPLTSLSETKISFNC